MRSQFLYPPREPVIHIERMFDAPRALVWEAFTRPEHIARWFGPRRYQSQVLEHELRVGGRWRIAHIGTDFEFFGEILEIAAPERLKQTFCFREFPPVTESFTLEDQGARTLFRALMEFDSVASRDGMAASGMESGASESYERLDEVLAELVSETA